MTTPNQPPPDDALSGEDLSALDGLNEASWRAGLNDRVIGTANSGSGFNGAAGFLGAIGNMIQGVMSGGFLGAILNPFASLMGMRWDQVDSQGESIQDLQDKTTNMTLSTGQATAYMTASPGTTTSPQRMPFTTQTRPPKNVTNLGDGRWRLDIAGEWDITAQVEFWGGILMPPGTHMQILVRTPSGSVYDGVTAHADSNANITVTNVTTTQIPTPGYTVEVVAWTDPIPIAGGSFRGIRGGYETTRLMMRKFEMETANE